MDALLWRLGVSGGGATKTLLDLAESLIRGVDDE